MIPATQREQGDVRYGAGDGRQATSQRVVQQLPPGFQVRASVRQSSARVMPWTALEGT